MPFVSQAQRRACWAQYNKDLAAGKKPQWDCVHWEKETPRQLKASMPASRNHVLTAKQDLQTYNNNDLQTLAKHYNLPDAINNLDNN